VQRGEERRDREKKREGVLLPQRKEKEKGNNNQFNQGLFNQGTRGRGIMCRKNNNTANAPTLKRGDWF
jgi:hypothetical protein